MRRLSRQELIEIMRSIMEGEGSEEEHQRLCDLFDANVPHPHGFLLAYWPEDYNARSDDSSEYKPTPEEVVVCCLSWKMMLRAESGY
ncbi:colicin immunity protein [Acidobacteriota bacterium]